jgi:flagellar motor switch protein FliG
LSGPEKVGLLLLALGRERAGELLKKFDSDELNMIMRSTEVMPTISARQLGSLVEEFENRLSQGTPFMGRPDDVKMLVSGVITENRSAADAILDDDSNEDLWARLPSLADDVLKSFLDRQHPQVAAYILSRMGAERSTSLLRLFPSDVRHELLGRIVGMRDVSFFILDALEESLQKELFDTDKGMSARHMVMAGILNAMDRTQSTEALNHIAEYRPKDAEAIRKMLFKFEDLTKLSPKALTALMDVIPVERTVIALQGMDAEFQTAVLATVSPRARRMAEAELQTGTNASPRDLAESRRTIVDSVLKLVADGTIELPAAA